MTAGGYYSHARQFQTKKTPENMLDKTGRILD